MSKLMRDAGENYHYINTIVKNKVELQKIKLTELSAKVVGAGLLILSFMVIGLLLLSVVFIGLGVFLSESLGSIYYSLLIEFCILIGIILILISFRKRIIFKPIQNLIYSIND